MRPLIVLVLVLLATAGLVLALVFSNDSSSKGPGQAIGPAGVTPAETTPGNGRGDSGLASVDDGNRESRDGVMLPSEVAPPRAQVSHPGQGNRLVGRVEDSEGKPVGGATLKLSREPLMGDALVMNFFNQRPVTNKPVEVTSDDKGAYLFRDVAPASDYYLVAYHTDFSPVQESLVFVGERGEFTGPVIVLRAGSELNGYVRDIGGNPVPAADLFLDSAYNMTWDMPNPDRMATQSDNTGYYGFRNVPQGPRNLMVRADGYGVKMLGGSELQFKGEAGESREINFVLEPGFPIVGTVVDPQGVGVAEAKVSAVHFQNQTTSRGEATTDELGRFQIDDLMDGSYIMMVQAPGYSQARMNRVQAGKMDVVIDLKRQACISGRLVTPAGFAGSLRVELQRTTPKTSPTDTQIFEATNLMAEIAAGTDGSFRICGVEPGYYLVLGLGQGFAPTQSPALQVLDGQDPAPVTVSLGVGGSLRGRVVTPAGAPLAGANVVSRDNLSPDAGHDTFFGSFVTSNATERSATTNAEGEYLLPNLAPGLYKVVVEQADYAGFTAKDLQVGEGQVIDVNPITLRDGGIVRGTVTRAASAVERAFLQLYSTTEPSRSYQARTDSAGRFEFLHVRPGSYKLSATRTSPTSSSDPFQAILDQQASEVVLSVGEGTTTTRELTLGG